MGSCEMIGAYLHKLWMFVAVGYVYGENIKMKEFIADTTCIFQRTLKLSRVGVNLYADTANLFYNILEKDIGALFNKQSFFVKNFVKSMKKLNE